MGNNGIKVKDLAKELGVTSRQIIDRCRGEGIWVQNSITRLPPETTNLVRSWFSGASSSELATKATEGEAVQPDGSYSPGSTEQKKPTTPFRPIRIRGEPLSRTIIRDRRHDRF